VQAIRRSLAFAFFTVLHSFAAEERPFAVVEAQRTRPPFLDMDEAPALDRALSRASSLPHLRLVGRGYEGFRIKLGQLMPTSGFTAGPEYVRRDLRDGNLMIRASARFSQQNYVQYDGELAIPQVSRRTFLNIYAAHRELPRLHYFGQGQDSREEDFTNYGLDDTRGEITAGFRFTPVIRVGGTGGYYGATAGPGTLPATPSIEQFFTPVTAAGLGSRTSFLTGGAFIEYDSTDVFGSPRQGSVYSVRLTNYAALESRPHSFRRVDVDLRRYFSFFNRQRVFALRAYSTLTGVSAGRHVPFYLQPTLGGPDTLRGYRAFRFYDNNLLLLNGEYRWKLTSGLEMALFADAGRVAARVRDLDPRDLEASYGIGLRVNSRGNVFARLDFGCGAEGCRIWVKFNNIY
jgi:hypothetical protein